MLRLLMLTKRALGVWPAHSARRFSANAAVFSGGPMAAPKADALFAVGTPRRSRTSMSAQLGSPLLVERHALASLYGSSARNWASRTSHFRLRLAGSGSVWFGAGESPEIEARAGPFPARLERPRESARWSAGRLSGFSCLEGVVEGRSNSSVIGLLRRRRRGGADRLARRTLALQE